MDIKSYPNPSGRIVRSGPFDNQYYAFIPNPLAKEIKLNNNLYKLLAKAYKAIGELSGFTKQIENPYILTQPLITKEAELSSKIEGTIIEINDLYKFQARPSLFDENTKTRNDITEVNNYILALNYGLRQQEKLPLSLRLIKEMHAKLMSNVRGGTPSFSPGEFRETQNWIGAPNSLLKDADYVPPPPAELFNCLADFEKYIRLPIDDKECINDGLELVRLAQIHYQFEAIHPFCDGNGRIGRMLIAMLLVSWEVLPEPILYMSQYFELKRDEYYRRLASVSKESDWEGWTSFFLDGIVYQSRKTLAQINLLLNLKERWKNLISKKRESMSLFSLIESLFVAPYLTVSEAQKKLDLSYNAAKKNIDKLCELNILTPGFRIGKEQFYIAFEIINIIRDV